MRKLSLIVLIIPLFGVFLILRNHSSNQRIATRPEGLNQQISEPQKSGEKGELSLTTSFDKTSHSKETLLVITNDGDSMVWSSLTPAAYEAKVVEVQSTLKNPHATLIKEGQLIEFALFNGNTVSGRVVDSKWWTENTLSVRASIEGDPDGFITLSAVGGVVRALVYRSQPHEVYQLRFDTTLGEHVLLHVDEAGSHELGCSNPEHDHSSEGDFNGDYLEDIFGSFFSSFEALLNGESETIVTLNVMAVYTQAALANEGSLDNMLANIAQAMNLSNQVHSNSDTFIEFNLAHTVEVDYVESTTQASADLRVLRTSGDGIIDEVHVLREVHEADFVTMFLDTELTGGLAGRPSSYERPDLAFSIVRVQQSDTTSYTTVHEIAHNMGIGHSKTQARQPGDGGFFTYAAGWQWADASSSASIGFCSVMTDGNFDGNSSTGVFGAEFNRVAHLSNPNVLRNGIATGDAVDGDAARTIREGRFFYSKYRGSSAVPTFSQYPYHYGFEFFTSAWAQSTFDELDWTIDQTGETRSPDTGPDAAQAGDTYAYVEASANAELASVLQADFDFTTLSQPQISFYYHMFDGSFLENEMGDLFFEVSTDVGQTWITEFSRSGNQGDIWHLAQVDLSAYAGSTVRLRFRGVVGTNFRSDIAIDSITIMGVLAGISTNFSEWLSQNHPTISDTSPGGDPDFDGVSSFLEYALGRSPEVAESELLPSVIYDPATQTINYSFNRAQASVRYVVMSVEDLTEWGTPTIEWDSNTATNLVDIGLTQTVNVSAAEPKKFIRLDVTEP